MTLLDSNNDPFINQILDEELKQLYYKKLSDGIKRIKKETTKEIKKEKEKYLQYINESEKHDELVSMSIFPFIQNTYLTSELGYKFRYCDPLFEKGFKNFDALVVKETNKTIICIFIEAKTGVYSEHVKEIEQKQKICEDNRQYIIHNYLNDTKLKVIFEYVIAVYSMDTDDILDFIKNYYHDDSSAMKNNIIIWKCDRYESKLSVANIGKTNPLKQKMLHLDQSLNRKLCNLETSHKTLSFYPQSHIVTKIKSLINLIQSNKILDYKKNEFSTSEVDEYFQKTLFYLNINDINELRKYVLLIAEEINLIVNKGGGKFTVKKEYSGSSLKSITVEKLWIENKINKNKINEIEDLRKKIQSEILELAKTKPRLDEFFP